jgi:8-oxo-dGTP pyrophosphatase MutT (NUDIX family)
MMAKELRAESRINAFTIDQKLQRLHERQHGLPYSGADYVQGSEDLDRVLPHHDGKSEHELAVAVDKLDRMPARRHNFDPESIDIGSMDRPVGEELVHKLKAEREFVVQLPTSYNEMDGTMNVVRINVMAASVEEAMSKAEAELRARLADGARIVSASLIKSGRETGFGGGVLLWCQSTGRFLFIKRSDTGDEPGTWCVPGGGIEDGETIDQGTKRELAEECGYEEPIELLFMHRDVQPNFIFHNHMAIVPEEFEPVLNEEHTDYQWCEADQLPQPMHPRLENAMAEWTTKNSKDGGPE